MDAVPVTLGQEFGGYAAQVRLGQERVVAALEHVRQIPLGGTGDGHGPQHASEVRRDGPPRPDKADAAQIEPPVDPFEGTGSRDALVELSGALKVVAVSLSKIAQDIALMGSGPRAGHRRDLPARAAEGLSIMPGKVNPVIPEVVLQVAAQVIGNDTAITVGGCRAARAQRAHPADRAQPPAVHPPAVDGIGRLRREVRRRDRGQPRGHEALGRGRRSRWPPPSTSTSATTRARRSCRRRPRRGARCARSRSRKGVDAELYDRVIDPAPIAAGAARTRGERQPPANAAPHGGDPTASARPS
jgi:fumarate hydratase class II